MAENPTTITSLQNDRVKDLVKLRNRRVRDEHNLTIIEEPLVIERALAAGFPLKSVFFCPEQLTDQGHTVLKLLQGLAAIEQIQVTAPVMAKISYRDKPEGLLATALQQHVSLSDLEAGPQTLLVILEAVEKPGNLGAILRIADGAGADAVIICGQGTDLHNPNVLRASRGAFFSVPTVAAATDEALAFCRKNSITTVATSPSASVCYSDCDLKNPVALVLGTEHEGLSPSLMSACDQTVSLPMLGKGDSLNVAASCAVVLYEAVRQRRT